MTTVQYRRLLHDSVNLNSTQKAPVRPCGGGFQSFQLSSLDAARTILTRRVGRTISQRPTSNPGDNATALPIADQGWPSESAW